MDKLYDVGVIVGRFQVPDFTDGHKQLIKTAVTECKSLVVFLGVSVVLDSDRNAMDFVTREFMFEYLKNTQGVKVTVLPIPDIFNDELWSK